MNWSLICFIVRLLSLAHASHGRQSSAQLLPKLAEGLVSGFSDRSQLTGSLDGRHGPFAGQDKEQVERAQQDRSFVGEPKLGKQLKQAAAAAFDLWDERLLLDIIPIVLGQRACNENGTYARYRHLLLSDHSNDDIAHSSPEEIIDRSGFHYERHESISDDGYSTKLLRLKNPLMRGRPLKQPPVMLLQSGAISATVFIAASSIQHHPERPDELLANSMGGQSSRQDQSARSADESKRRSSSRSLAFMLSNQGYDVWIAESRGHRSKMMLRNPMDSIAESLGKTGKSVASLLFGVNKHKNMTLGQKVIQLSRSTRYWTYSFDEIIQHELKNQIERVLEVSGAHNVTLVSYSFSSMVTLPFLASWREFASRRVHNLVLMAPILSNRGANSLFNYLYQRPCLSLPDDLIGFLGTEQILTKPLRKLFLKLARHSAAVRYKILKFLLYLFQGPSGQYRTFLEPALLGHFLEPTSLLQVKHFCQQVLARKYQRYNFGRLKNLLIYGREEPLAYNVSQISLQPGSWLLVSAANDNLGTKDSVEQLLAELQTKPAEHIEVAGYAHFDLVAGVDNDRRVNLPILNFLERRRYQLE